MSRKRNLTNDQTVERAFGVRIKKVTHYKEVLCHWKRLKRAAVHFWQEHYKPGCSWEIWYSWPQNFRKIFSKKLLCMKFKLLSSKHISRSASLQLVLRARVNSTQTFQADIIEAADLNAVADIERIHFMFATQWSKSYKTGGEGERVGKATRNAFHIVCACY